MPGASETVIWGTLAPPFFDRRLIIGLTLAPDSMAKLRLFGDFAQIFVIFECNDDHFKTDAGKHAAENNPEQA